MIRYVKGGRVRFHQNREPQHPFWQSTTISPYTPDTRSLPLGLDLIRLTGTAPRSVEVRVPPTIDENDLDRLPSPILIDARGPEEAIYRRGDRLLHDLPADARPMLLISTDGDVPREIAAAAPLLVVTTWPLDPDGLEMLGRRAQRDDLAWGAHVPVMFPLTTSLGRLEEIATIVAESGGRFLAAASIELDQKAKRVVAEMSDELDEETWATLFDSSLEPIHVATERHIAALAHERSLQDRIDPWQGEGRSNRAAAAFLGGTGSRMVRMEHDVELGWAFLKASRRIATLDKELTRLVSAAHVTIVPELEDEVLAEVIEQWLDEGRADFTDHIDDKWRLKRS